MCPPVDNLSTGRIENLAHRLGGDRLHFMCDTILNRDLMDHRIARVDLSTT